VGFKSVSKLDNLNKIIHMQYFQSVLQMLQVVPVQSSRQKQIPFCKVPLFSHTRLGLVNVVLGGAVAAVWSVKLLIISLVEFI